MRPVAPFLQAGTAMAVFVVLTVAACTASAAAPSAGPGSAATATATPRASLSAPRSPARPSPPPRSPSPPPSPSPSPKPKPRPRVALSTVRTADGSVITVAAFRGPVRYVLHNGSADPGALATAKGVKAGPAVGGAERKHLLAAFNGGFKLAVGAGGYEQEGKVISPLLNGYASLIIDASGKAHIADWGHGAPARGEKVYSVRQNLGLLVSRGKPVPTAASWQDWGGTINGAEYVARSAIGENAAGDLIYAGSMSAVPEDLATALVKAGARIGMELDINPFWVQLDVASRPGGPLRTAVPGQWHPADTYLLGWSRDFFTVLAG